MKKQQHRPRFETVYRVERILAADGTYTLRIEDLRSNVRFRDQRFEATGLAAWEVDEMLDRFGDGALDELRHRSRSWIMRDRRRAAQRTDRRASASGRS